MDDESLKSRRGRSALGVELAILRMSANVERAGERGLGPGWWVLAVGDKLDGRDFGGRERARERLRLDLEEAGIRLPEYTWVWDETSRAQVVLAVCEDGKCAEDIAGRVRENGIPVRIRREFE
jgi:hypothetical protein